MMNDTQSPADGQGTEVLVRRVHPENLPGVITKTLDVGPGQQGIVVRRGQATVLGPGRHRVGWAWGGLPDDIGLVDTRPAYLVPEVSGVFSGDKQALVANLLVRVQASDPVRLFQALDESRTYLTVGELAGRLASSIAAPLAAAARQFVAGDLCGSETVAQQIGAAIHGPARAYLESAGLALLEAGRPSFVTQEEAVRRVEAIHRLRNDLQKAEVRARLEAARTEREFQDTLRQIEHEYGLRDALRQDELAEVRREMAGPPPAEEPKPVAGEKKPLAEERKPTPPEVGKAVDQLVKALDKKLASQQEQLLGRFEEMLKKAGYKEPKDEKRDAVIEELRRWVNILRAVGSIIVLGTTLAYTVMPQLFADPRLPQIITCVVGIVLAVIAFVWSFWYEGKARARRRENLARAEEDRLSPARRLAAMQMVNAEVAGHLGRVRSNLEEAWTRAFRSPLQNLATALRSLAKAVPDLQDELRASTYAQSTLLARKQVNLDDLRRILDLNDALLQQAQDAADTSQTMYRRVVEDMPGDVEVQARKLEIALQDLRNMIIKRNALLKGA